MKNYLNLKEYVRYCVEEQAAANESPEITSTYYIGTKEYEKAEEIIRKYANKGRADYLLSLLYQLKGKKTEASKHLNKAAKKHVPEAQVLTLSICDNLKSWKESENTTDSIRLNEESESIPLICDIFCYNNPGSDLTEEECRQVCEGVERHKNTMTERLSQIINYQKELKKRWEQREIEAKGNEEKAALQKAKDDAQNEATTATKAAKNAESYAVAAKLAHESAAKSAATTNAAANYAIQAKLEAGQAANAAASAKEKSAIATENKNKALEATSSQEAKKYLMEAKLAATEATKAETSALAHKNNAEKEAGKATAAVANEKAALQKARDSATITANAAVNSAAKAEEFASKAISHQIEIGRIITKATRLSKSQADAKTALEYAKKVNESIHIAAVSAQTARQQCNEAQLAKEKALTVKTSKEAISALAVAKKADTAVTENLNKASTATANIPNNLQKAIYLLRQAEEKTNQYAECRSSKFWLAIFRTSMFCNSTMWIIAIISLCVVYCMTSAVYSGSASIILITLSSIALYVYRLLIINKECKYQYFKKQIRNSFLNFISCMEDVFFLPLYAAPICALYATPFSEIEIMYRVSACTLIGIYLLSSIAVTVFVLIFFLKQDSFIKKLLISIAVLFLTLGITAPILEVLIPSNAVITNITCTLLYMAILGLIIYLYYFYAKRRIKLIVLNFIFRPIAALLFFYITYLFSGQPLTSIGRTIIVTYNTIFNSIETLINLI